MKSFVYKKQILQTIKKNTLKGYTNYTKIRTNAIRANRGISTFIKDSYSSEEILINTPLESVTISIQLKQNITICNLYLSNQSPFIEADLKNIIQQLSPPFILLSDFNSHNKLWDCISTNTRGKIIESLIDSENLITLNNGRPTHFGTASGTQSAIDLTFTTPSFAPHLTWDTLSHPYGSDHLPIITKLTYRKTEDIQVGKPKWKLNTADWNLFTSLLEQKIDSIEFENPKINNLNEVTQNFTNAILEIANLTIGQTIFSGRKPPVPWWNSHCNESIKKTAFNKFKRTKSQDDFIEFKKRIAQARRTIKDSKTSSWRAYTSSINSKANSKQIWNIIKAFKCIDKYDNIQILKNENHTIYSEPSEIANELGSFFLKASSTETYPLEFQRYKCAQEIVPINLCQNHDNNHINSPLSIQEMETALSSKKSNACGIDNIPTIFLLNLPKNGKLYLLKIFNHIWMENQYPTTWVTAIIKPIHKPNKPKNHVSSYRPISIICSMTKLLEKIINARLMWYLESNNLLSNLQHGFRKNNSTLDSLAIIENEIKETFNQNQYLGNIINFIINYLSNRTIQVSNNGALSSPFILHNGSPQGSPLSSTLFLLAINDLPSIIKPPNKITMYADDSNIFCRGNNLPTLIQQIQNCINCLLQWSKTSGFTFSPIKSQFIIFSKKNIPYNPSLKMENTNIPRVFNIKILGLTFDSKLTWRTHINNIKNEAKTKLNIIKTLSNLEWGAESKTLQIIHNSIILSALEYGSILYAGASALTIKTLEPIHNTALRLSIGAFKSSSVLSIINITGSKSLEKRRIKHTLEYSSKTLIATKNPISTILRNSINQFQNNDINNLGTRTATYASDLNISFTNQLNPQASEQPPWITKITSNLLIYFNLTAHKKKETDSYIYKSNFFNLKNSLPPHQEIYIDASKNTEGTAIAIIQPNSQTAFQIPSYNSIYTAEYLALLKATELAASSDIQSSTIYTDSLSALTNLANPQKNNPIGNLILNIIFLSKKDIRFLWVPGHNNIPGNEIADEIVKKATKEPTDFWNITTHLDTKLLINTNLDQTCLQEWRSLRNNKLREIKSSTLPWLPDTSLPRRHQIVLNRLRIGHTLYTHEHLMSKKEQPICTSCNTVTTVKHLLTECLLTKDVRDKLMLPNNLCEILAPNTERTSSLLELLKETNLLQKI
ncbi:hypothetical protein QTP88_002656 [Uroleucon formosanum]